MLLEVIQRMICEYRTHDIFDIVSFGTDNIFASIKKILEEKPNKVTPTTCNDNQQVHVIEKRSDL